MRLTTALSTTTLAALSTLWPGSAPPADPHHPGGTASDDSLPEWNAATVEHLLNRAAFGARAAQIQRGVEMGPEALVDQLFTGLGELPEPFFAEPLLPPSAEELRRMGDQARQQLRSRRSQYEREQRGAFVAWWIEQMMFGNDPLRERMTLFWHGHFTSSMRDVRNSRMMVEQMNFLRDNALGSFRTLVHGIVKNPAMLVYLNNDENHKKSPNENLARELMELFTLGEGNYSERDVKEAARALTGYQVERARFAFNERDHDRREKTVLGVRGDLDAESLVEILLAQEACPRWLADRMLRYLEGREPPPERIEEYAAHLRDTDFDIQAFLGKLFLDPGFYSSEVVGNRIAGPIDFVVGTCRRLGVRPPIQVLSTAAGLLGQELLAPPSVKGWDGAETWITTSSFQQRGNVAGMLLGVVNYREVLAAEREEFLQDEGLERGDRDLGLPADDEMRATRGVFPARPSGARTIDRPVEQALPKSLTRLGQATARPHIHLTERMRRIGAKDDEAVVDALCEDLLAVSVSEQSRRALLGFLNEERHAARDRSRRNSPLLRRLPKPDPESLRELSLRRLAHLVLSLPEAQLH